jgi:uncharacterized membrane protein YidH (DUF202 family)
MNDVSILDLFWLILKFLAALGLVVLIALGLYLIWAGVRRLARIALDIVRGGHNSSVAAIVSFSIAIMVLATLVAFAVSYFK